ncbi:MAG: hypothetical protein F6J89_26770 [Symploca sp. SIO1C4]|uniref:Uncharacterized protein n=1 Tax=Symploca sp. SIO1C4 TaxID=2607765 RepID=A0A6B3NJT6_9CYAN|nr:hypothetical protein [Symploca sp. SIO1C4]
MSKKQLVGIRVLMPVEVREDFKTLCAIKKTTMNRAVVDFIVSFIEENEALLLPVKEDQQGTFEELIRQNYFQLVNNGIDHQRLNELAFGEKPLAKEREKIKKILGLDELPES